MSKLLKTELKEALRQFMASTIKWRKLAEAGPVGPTSETGSIPAGAADTLQHGMNCPGNAPEYYDGNECTCGLKWRIQLQTEREMHNAWRKRAEEAERALAANASAPTVCPAGPVVEGELRVAREPAEIIAIARRLETNLAPIILGCEDRMKFRITIESAIWDAAGLREK